VIKGYDSDDFKTTLGLTRATKLLYYIIISNPKVSNANFIIHSYDFIAKNFKEFSSL
jgi:hypothetical protein